MCLSLERERKKKGKKKEETVDINEVRKKLTFHIGDMVRVSRIKGTFDKGYHPRWSEEIFRIVEVRMSPSSPARYYLNDYDGERVQGGFYAQELQKTKYPSVYLIDEILERKRGKVLVSWLGGVQSTIAGLMLRKLKVHKRLFMLAKQWDLASANPSRQICVRNTFLFSNGFDFNAPIE